MKKEITFDRENAHSAQLSLNQKRIWFASQLNPSTPAYNLPFIYRFKGELNTELFKKSYQNVINSQEILFSKFFLVKNEPNVKIEYHDFNLIITDVSGIDEQEFYTWITGRKREFARRNLDIQKGPLFFGELIKRSNYEWYFLFLTHHIVFDGWSWGIFINLLSHSYNSLISDKNPEIPVQKIHGKNEVLKELEVLEKEREKLEHFWKHYLEGADTENELLYDHQRPKDFTGLGGMTGFKISKPVSRKLFHLGQSKDVSLFNIVFSIFALLVSRYTGQRDFILGAPVAYRPDNSLKSKFGMFVSTIPVRIQVDENLSFIDFMNRVNQSFLDAYSYISLPFEDIVKLAPGSGSPNMNPLFQIAFSWLDNLFENFELEGIESQKQTFEEGKAPFDITFYMGMRDQSFEGEIEYNLDVLDEKSIKQIINNFLQLTANISEKPEDPLSTIQMISIEEKQKILGFSGSKTNYPRDKSLIQLFREQVLIRGDKTAVQFRNKKYSYKYLNDLTDRLAVQLMKRGVAREIPVGLLFNRSPEMVFAQLAILKAGGFYVPADPEYPNARIEFIFRDSGVKFILSQEKFADKIPEGKNALILEELLKNSVGQNMEGIVNEPDDTAYVMYTSGTTGVPKGSKIRHRSVIRLVRDTNYINILPEDCILMTGAVVFDATTFEIWGALLNGATLAIVEKDVILDPYLLESHLKETQTTILWLTSPLFNQLSEVNVNIFSDLKYLLVGGDVLSPVHINRVRNIFPDLMMINGYGPTENTTFSTCFTINRTFDKSIPIGIPISNSSAYIIDDSRNLQPIGVPGELLLGGDGLSKGYLNREDFNKERFIVNPLNPLEVLYKTGDKARWLEDGNIEFLGRKDQQVKIRGFRIEIKEIERIILDIENVNETFIMLSKENKEKLIAFISLSKMKTNLNIDSLQHILSEKLPAYMIPEEIHILEKIPKNINGKIDTGRLYAYVINDNSHEQVEDTDSLSGTEKRLHKIWSETLGNTSIKTTDNFFVIGGNSLLAIPLMVSIEKEFGTKIMLRKLFDYPTIRSLAEQIDILYSLDNEKGIDTNRGDTLHGTI